MPLWRTTNVLLNDPSSNPCLSVTMTTYREKKHWCYHHAEDSRICLEEEAPLVYPSVPWHRNPCTAGSNRHQKELLVEVLDCVLDLLRRDDNDDEEIRAVSLKQFIDRGRVAFWTVLPIRQLSTVRSSRHPSSQQLVLLASR